MNTRAKRFFSGKGKEKSVSLLLLLVGSFKK